MWRLVNPYRASCICLKKGDIWETPGQTNLPNVRRQRQVITLIYVGRTVGNPQPKYLSELWRASTNINFAHSNFALMFDPVSTEWIHGCTLFNHQHVTDVWTNCRERHGQVRMFPLLVSSLLSAADFPNSAHKCPLQYSSRQIRRLPHLNLALGSPRTQPPAPRPSLFSVPPGVCWDAPRAQHLTVPVSRPRGWGGANQSLLGSFLLSCAHLKSDSQQGYVMPCRRLPLATPHSPIRGTGPP